MLRSLLFQENSTIYLIDQIDLNKILEDINKSTLNPTTFFKKLLTKFPPPNINPNVAIFLKQTIRDICKLPLKKNNPTNLTVKENKALDNLHKNKSIIIKASDKGGNVFIMKNSHYKCMCLRILNISSWYKSIPLARINRFNNEFYMLVDQAYGEGTISKDLWEFIRIKHPRVATFYSLTKIHKNSTDPTGRPIVSGRTQYFRKLKQSNRCFFTTVCSHYALFHQRHNPLFTKN